MSAVVVRSESAITTIHYPLEFYKRTKSHVRYELNMSEVSQCKYISVFLIEFGPCIVRRRTCTFVHMLQKSFKLVTVKRMKIIVSINTILRAVHTGSPDK